MKSFREKIQPFLLGLMLGLLVGVGFFIFKLDDYFSELNFYKNLSKKNITQVEVDSEKSKKNETKTEKPVLKPISSKVPVQTSTLNTDSLSKAKMINSADSTLVSAGSDTSITTAQDDEEIVVKKDELITSRSLDVIALTKTLKSSSDTIGEKVSGVKTPSVSTMIIEFWQSPLNYKGYKMSKNKLVIYGIASSGYERIYKYENTLLLKAANGVYKLDYTNDFRSFERIDDSTILALVNNAG